MIRTSQLDGVRVRRRDGKSLGVVHEVRATEGQVTVLICGPAGLWQRLSQSQRGRRIAWERVVAITDRELVVDDDIPTS